VPATKKLDSERIVAAIDEYITYAHVAKSEVLPEARTIFNDLRLLDEDVLKQFDPTWRDQHRLPRIEDLGGWFVFSGVTGTAMWDKSLQREMNTSTNDEHEVRFIVSRCRLVGEQTLRKAYKEHAIAQYGPGGLIQVEMLGFDKHCRPSSWHVDFAFRGRHSVAIPRDACNATITPAAWDIMCNLARGALHSSLSLFQQEPYLWRAQVACEGSPSIGIPTDAIGIRELFRFRDLPAGASRRPALLHWVREHWRQSREDAEAELFVRKHLRGCRNFTQGDLRIAIAEAPEERKEAAEAVLDRKERKKRLEAIRRKAR
jgi:hypothetical protein